MTNEFEKETHDPTKPREVKVIYEKAATKPRAVKVIYEKVHDEGRTIQVTTSTASAEEPRIIKWSNVAKKQELEIARLKAELAEARGQTSLANQSAGRPAQKAEIKNGPDYDQLASLAEGLSSRNKSTESSEDQK